VLEFGVELVLEVVAGSAGTCALWAAALDHEIVDDSVEGEAIVKAIASEFFEVGNGFGCFVVEQLDAKFTFIGGKSGNFHGQSLSDWEGGGCGQGAFNARG